MTDPSRDGASPLRVRAAEPADFERISRCIGEAFQTDPLAAYFFPDDATRARRYASFSRFVMNLLSRHGAIDTSDPIYGAAVWQAPSPPEPTRLQILRSALAMAACMRGAFFRAAKLGELTRPFHPDEPHWYLAVLGTEPDRQGRGIGSALLRSRLEICDAMGLRVYLESSKDANLPFYERHGFRVVGQIVVPRGPTLWPMVRPLA